MTAEIIITALDVRDDQDEYGVYAHLSAVEKMVRIKKRIIDICEQLKKQHPNAMWILAWQESAIFGKRGLNNEFLGKGIHSHLAARFKYQMSELTKRFPNLTIIAGTLPVRKPVQNIGQLNAIKRSYRPYQWISVVEKNVLEDDLEAPYTLPFKTHLNQVSIFIENKKQVPDLHAYSKICYIFTSKNGEPKIFRHDKSAPFEETENEVWYDKKFKPHHIPDVFCPARPMHSKQIFTLEHPTTKEPIDIGVEICREHVIGLLKHLNPEKKPLLHFILSASCYVDNNNMHCQHSLIHIDSQKEPELRALKGVFEQYKITFLKNDLLKEDTKLIDLTQKPKRRLKIKLA